MPSVDIKSQFSRILIELGATIETREWVLQQEFLHTIVIQPQKIGVQDLKVIGARNKGPEKRRLKKWVPVGDPFKHIENRACLGFGYLCSPSVNPPPIE